MSNDNLGPKEDKAIIRPSEPNLSKGFTSAAPPPKPQVAPPPPSPKEKK